MKKKNFLSFTKMGWCSQNVKLPFPDASASVPVCVFDISEANEKRGEKDGSYIMPLFERQTQQDGRSYG